MAKKPNEEVIVLGAVNAARQVAKVAKTWVQKNKKQLGTPSVKTRPVNGSMIQLTFEGMLSDERKEHIKAFVQNGFKTEVAPIIKEGLDCSNFRIVTCSRNKSSREYCWLIQKR